MLHFNILKRILVTISEVTSNLDQFATVRVMPSYLCTIVVKLLGAIDQAFGLSYYMVVKPPVYHVEIHHTSITPPGLMYTTVPILDTPRGVAQSHGVQPPNTFSSNTPCHYLCISVVMLCVMLSD